MSLTSPRNSIDPSPTRRANKSARINSFVARRSTTLQQARSHNPRAQAPAHPRPAAGNTSRRRPTSSNPRDPYSARAAAFDSRTSEIRPRSVAPSRAASARSSSRAADAGAPPSVDTARFAISPRRRRTRRSTCSRRRRRRAPVLAPRRNARAGCRSSVAERIRGPRVAERASLDGRHVVDVIAARLRIAVRRGGDAPGSGTCVGHRGVNARPCAASHFTCASASRP